MFWFVIVLVGCVLDSSLGSYTLPTSFNELAFQKKIENTLSRIRKVLDREKQPLLAPAADVPHEYNDKYLLTELLGNVALSSTTTVLEVLGLDHDKQRTAITWASDNDVSLKFTMTPSCLYSREETKEVLSDKYIKEEQQGIFTTTKTTKRMVQKVTEHFWDFSVHIKLQVCTGGMSHEKCLDLVNDMAKQELVTTYDSHVDSPVHDLQERVIEVNISPYLRSLDKTSLIAAFRIDRKASTCVTPVRNPEIDMMISQFQELGNFCDQISAVLQSKYTHSKQRNYFMSLSGSEVFTPIVPLLNHYDKNIASLPESGDTETSASESQSRMISPTALNALLQEEEANLKSKIDKFNGFDSEMPGDIISTRGATVFASLQHIADIVQGFHASVSYVENLMRSELIKSIGKEVKSRDVVEYTNFYAKKLLLPDVAPAPLSHPVRRSATHSPEGMFTLEQSFPGTQSPVPLFSLSRKISSSAETASPVMSFPLDASTHISFSGDQFVHAYLHQSFSSPLEDEPKVIFSARARQFSSFVLLLGKMATSDSFEPQHAMIVRSKDELKVALKLAVIPTQKEFRNAIRSLSRNQQAFATAFRSMQLEGSLFTAVVIQIKPQLERVLNLPPQSLQQEIELTEDLMDLFIQHQIPSDLLKATYDESDLKVDAASDLATSKPLSGIEHVKNNVKSIKGMIERSREKELKEKKEYDEYHNIRGRGPEEVVSLSGAASTNSRGKIMRKSSFTVPSGVPASASMPKDVLLLDLDERPMQDGGSERFSSDAQSSSKTESAEKTQSSTTAYSASSIGSSGYDYTSLPQRLQDAFEQRGGENVLRPTIVTVDENSWILESQKTVFSPRQAVAMGPKEQQQNKKQALDLLDALTRSGALPVTDASLHVLVTATHVFDRSVLETLVQRDVNPLERLEQSMLIMLQTLHEKPLQNLVSPHFKPALMEHHPYLFMDDADSSTKGKAENEKSSSAKVVETKKDYQF